jgi:hypothetical protein
MQHQVPSFERPPGPDRENCHGDTVGEQPQKDPSEGNRAPIMPRTTVDSSTQSLILLLRTTAVLRVLPSGQDRVRSSPPLRRSKAFRASLFIRTTSRGALMCASAQTGQQGRPTLSPSQSVRPRWHRQHRVPELRPDTPVRCDGTAGSRVNRSWWWRCVTATKCCTNSLPASGLN